MELVNRTKNGYVTLFICMALGASNFFVYFFFLGLRNGSLLRDCEKIELAEVPYSWTEIWHNFLSCHLIMLRTTVLVEQNFTPQQLCCDSSCTYS